MTAREKVLSKMLLEELKPRVSWYMSDCLAAGGFSTNLKEKQSQQMTLELLDLVLNRQTLFQACESTATVRNTKQTVSLRVIK